jgi:hypothetical protein
MPRQGNGTYVLPAGNPVTPSTLIRSEWANTTLTDIGTALTNSIAKDGQTVPTADLPMGGFKHTNVVGAVGVGQYAESRQIQNWELLRLNDTATSTGTAYVATLILGSNSWDDGTTFIWRPLVTNTGAATISINGAAALPILNAAGQPLIAGDMTAGGSYFLRKLAAAWYLIPFASTGGMGDYVLKTGDTMSGPLTVGATPGTDAQLTVIASGGNIGQFNVGITARQPYLGDFYHPTGNAILTLQSGANNQAMRWRVTAGNYILDCKPMAADGSIPATPSAFPFVLQMNDAAGAGFNALTVDTQGSLTANYQASARLFRAAHFLTTLPAGAQIIDLLQYQSWYLLLTGDIAFTLVNMPLGMVARIVTGGAHNITWAAGSDTIYWPNSAGNAPPTQAQIAAGPLEHCLFTFFKFQNGYIMGQWSAY